MCRIEFFTLSGGQQNQTQKSVPHLHQEKKHLVSEHFEPTQHNLRRGEETEDETGNALPAPENAFGPVFPSFLAKHRFVLKAKGAKQTRTCKRIS